MPSLLRPGSPNRPASVLTPPRPDRELVVLAPDGARLHTEVHGPDDAPAVLLVHGWTCSTAFWAPVIRALVAEGHRVIAYDLRGHGRSALADPAGYGTDTLAEDLCAVLDATLAPGERAVLGGHSMGAMTLVAAADREPLRSRAAALMLCSSGMSGLVGSARVVPVRAPALRARIQTALLGSKLPLGPVTPVSRAILRYVTMSREASREQVDVCARIVHACPRRSRAAWAHVLDEVELLDRLPLIDVPTAVVAGTADRLTPASAHAHRMAAALPHCVGLTKVPGRGHMTPVERPDLISGVLATLVREHLTAAGGTEREPGDSGESAMRPEHPEHPQNAQHPEHPRNQAKEESR
ncbi:alpha/beta fold hydrolase [Streptomyces oceani]|uniref:alpha/beta fold hydrolase n=1 Tax=Streptomyces oceani TaxID=1075402 RepID=UPI000871C596|nr:alpha/beta hydrolase [Streptomyces oceani]